MANDLMLVGIGGSDYSDPLYGIATPSLDLQFAANKTLVDLRSGNNLITFTRSSSATYFDSTGTLRRATTNLLLRSEEFDNASWLAGTATITADTQTAPNGSTTADTLTTISGSPFLFQDVTCTASTVYTFSFYVRLGTMPASDFRFAVRDNSNSAFIATDIIPNITPVTSEWRRVSYTFTTPVGCTNVRPYLYRFAFTTGGTVHLWGAQLEQSSTVGEYIPTGATINSAPRFDHNPTTGESLGLLVEEQRTNLLPSSVYTSNANGWTNGVIGGTGTIASAVVTNKAGNTNGVFGVSGLDGSSYVGCFVSTVSSTNTYTASVFVRNNGGTVFQMRLVNQAGGTFKSSGTQYTFATGAWQDGIAGTATPVSRTVQDMGDGWLRFSITAADNGTGNAQTALLLFGGALTTNYNYYFWGAQLEVGAFPTSYIPTTTATVTRAVDVASISGSNFSSWYRQDEGTMYAQVVRASEIGSGRFPRLWSISDGTTSNAINGQRYGAGTFRPAVTTGGVGQAAFDTAPAVAAGSAGRFAYAIKQDDIAGATNGGTVVTDTSATMPTVNQMYIGDIYTPLTATNNNGPIARLTYFPQRISNANLQRITQ